MLTLEKLNPKFKLWFAAQSPELQSQIMGHWDETATDPAIAHGSPIAAYARATFVVNRCIEQHGFDPKP